MSRRTFSDNLSFIVVTVVLFIIVIIIFDCNNLQIIHREISNLVSVLN